MRRKISYYTTTNIYLSLEDFYNSGLTSEEAKSVIEKIVRPNQHLMYSSNDTLVCRPTGLNGNWYVEIFSNDDHVIEDLLLDIEWKLRNYLMSKKILEGLDK